GWHVGLHVRQPDQRPLQHEPRLEDGLSARAVPARVRRRPDRGVRPLPPGAPGDDELMDVALSRSGAWVLRAFFVLVVAFLYAPIVILLIFSFNDATLPTFPLSGFTLDWYGQFLHNEELHAALKTSVEVAALSSIGAVALGTLASLALVRRRFRGKAAVSV